MERCEIIDLKESILEDNDADAQVLREDLRDKGVFYMNVMSSPGSGKTTTILQTLNRIGDRFKVGVMEADIDSDVDARAILAAGYPAVQLHTGGMCHLDAEMSRQGMRALWSVMSREQEVQEGASGLAGAGCCELVILENVGNLVCPAEFDTGAHLDVVILSVPEGDDKPLKYPLMFEKCSVVLVNKIDACEVFDFSLERLEANVRLRNPGAKIFPICGLTGEGMDAWCEYLSEQVEALRKF